MKTALNLEMLQLLAKVLRNAVRNLMMNAADNRITSRLTQVMTQIKNYDTTSIRGSRTVAVGIADPAALALLIDFDFNDSAALSGVLFAPFTVTGATGAIDIPAFTPINDISYPIGATHVSFLNLPMQLLVLQMKQVLLNTTR